MARPLLGIMTLHFGKNKNLEEKRFFKKLAIQGKKMGLNVVVFMPQTVRAEPGAFINAYAYEGGGWRRVKVPLPPLVYDRCRFEVSEKFRQFRKFRAKHTQITFLNRPLSNKWRMHQLMSRVSDIRPYLPESETFESYSKLSAFLDRWKTVYVKPVNGTGGRGILRIRRLGDNLYQIQGRGVDRRIIPPRRLNALQLRTIISRWRLDRRFLIQQGIDLTLPDGRVHDYRMLLQKNSQGVWGVTGCAGRVGPPRSVTSNLHGGGKAISMEKLLSKRFPPSRVEALQKEMEKLGLAVARYLEEVFKEVCELGLDIAIDREGKPWILEVNPKPAREVFSRIGERETYRRALYRPLEYAMYVQRTGVR